MTTPALDRLVVGFDEATVDDRLLLGGKGSGLVQMTRLRIPVPPGFILTTECGREYRETGGLSPAIRGAIAGHLHTLESALGRRFGDPADPLLVSVRSGAPVSMPGMMDTILNVGLTAESVTALAAATGDDRFAYSCFEHLLTGYATSVKDIDPADVDDALDGLDHEIGDGARRCAALVALIEAETGSPFPGPTVQLEESVGAVFSSWGSRRAKAYRKHRGIDDSLGTAVVIQAMVYGNRSDTSGSGVVFTRNPVTGEPGPCGEYLARAQGEDVVSGEFASVSLDTLAAQLPETARRLDEVLAQLECHARDMCDVEFTVENGRLWILQTRVGQRGSRAAIRIAVDLAADGVISREEAVERIRERSVTRLRRVADPVPAASVLIARGIASSGGAAVGIAAFDPGEAADLAQRGADVILIRPTTSPSDMAGLIAARAVVTGRGGPMSHAAVVARGMDRPAVCGLGEISIAADRQSASLNGVPIRAGTTVTVDGDHGWIARGELPLIAADEDPYYRIFQSWSDELAAADEVKTR
ncbi:MAG: pyruvate, phosphate dikinase [Gordonia sp. (in: high G+C Gram-positive bacteria)]